MAKTAEKTKERKPKVKADETRDERMHVKLADLLPNPYQPPTRVEIDEETAKRFGLSILEHGLLQMPVVRVSKEVNKFEVGDGWLRLSGYKWLVKNKHPEYSEMPVVLRGFTDIEMADLVLEANSVRQDMNAVEKAWYYNKYLSDFKKVTQAEFAKRHNISQSEVANTIRLLELPDDVRAKIISREITESHGRALLSVKDKKLITKLAGEIVQYGWSVNTLNNVIKADADKISPTMLPKPEPAETKPPQIETPKAEAETKDKECDHNCAECDEPCENMKKGEEKSTETPEVKQSGTTAKKPEPKKTEPTKFSKCTGCKSSLPERMLTDGLCKSCQEKASRPKLSRPEAIGAPPTEPTKAGLRKLVLEEVGNGVKMSVMSEGKWPVMQTLNGNLEWVVDSLREFLASAGQKWSIETQPAEFEKKAESEENKEDE